MRADFYSILEVSHSADLEEIKQSYKRLAMKWHPDKNPGNENNASDKFAQINQAYSILSDPTKRKRYDLSIPLPTKGKTSSYNDKVPSRLSPNPRRIIPNDASFDQLYDKFYGPKGFAKKTTERDIGSLNPRTSCFGRSHSMQFAMPPSPNISSDNEPNETLIGDIEITVTCTLEEIYNGAAKIYNVIRSIDGEPDKKSFKVTLTPELQNGTKIVLAHQGNRRKYQPANDLIFIIEIEPHPIYILEVVNLKANVEISLATALIGEFKYGGIGVDSEPISFELHETIQPEFEYHIAKRGMKTKSNDRGDVIFKFHVGLPRLSDEDKGKLLSILPP